ncbi:MAG: hypothetical protein WBA74_18820 [Cyclobacteriaceae bacterium]
MTDYQNNGGDSGIVAYEIFSDAIHVLFNSEWIYEYNYTNPGMSEVEHMKVLAVEGEGLNAYIVKELGSRFANKWRA